MNRSALAVAANELPPFDRRPVLTEQSPLPALLEWLAFADPNGEWGRLADGDLREDDEPVDVDQAWAEIHSIVESAS